MNWLKHVWSSGEWDRTCVIYLIQAIIWLWLLDSIHSRMLWVSVCPHHATAIARFYIYSCIFSFRMETATTAGTYIESFSYTCSITSLIFVSFSIFFLFFIIDSMPSSSIAWHCPQASSCMEQISPMMWWQAIECHVIEIFFESKRSSITKEDKLHMSHWCRLAWCRPLSLVVDWMRAVPVANVKVRGEKLRSAIFVDFVESKWRCCWDTRRPPLRIAHDLCATTLLAHVVFREHVVVAGRAHALARSKNY